jgi:hypothetical protein
MKYLRPENRDAFEALNAEHGAIEAEFGRFVNQVTYPAYPGFDAPDELMDAWETAVKEYQARSIGFITSLSKKADEMKALLSDTP